MKNAFLLSGKLLTKAGFSYRMIALLVYNYKVLKEDLNF